ncbi:hypothetical protein COCON_G00168000 [Conger conger]|uniref:AKNA domain-containing protein n=1 Tax=Conger conger TaxID=82655 RepID=A0A9Q1HS81_CONCO|nr:hypothetical protein COCON_G00168000 [Conger conger]
MERRKAGRAGARGGQQGSDSGPPSSPCDSPWESGRETPQGRGDFFSHMDDNGIIGLDEVSAGEELEEGLEGGLDPPRDPGAPGPEDSPLDEDLLEDLSYGLSDLQDSEPQSPSPGHSLYDEDEEHVGLDDWEMEGNEEEEAEHGEEGAAGWATQEAQMLPERDRQLDMTDEEREGEDRDTRGRSEALLPVAVGTLDGRRGRDTVSRGGARGSDSAGEISAGPFSGVSSPFEGEDDGRGLLEEGFPNQDLSPNLHPSRGAGGPTLSRTRAQHLLHPLQLSTEQLDPVGGIDGETLPESGFTESIPESQSSRLSRAPPEPLAGRAEDRPGPGGGGGGVEETQEISPRPRPLPRPAPTPPDPGARTGPRAPPRAPRASTPKSSTEYRHSDHYGKGQLNFPLPDFSQVGPRVRIPRGEGYRPPKSKGPSLQGASCLSEPLLVYKSPAEIVREVLMSSGDSAAPRSPPSATPAPSLSSRPHRRVQPTVPQEFRSPEQATSLVHQLQEDYNKLLTKYAEAENTIDRLRLEAKVGLYSDPPKPSHSAQSGTIQKGSKVMTLTFPQPQRAEFSQDAVSPDPGQSGASCAESSSSQAPGPRPGEQMTEELASLTGTFQAQLDSFEDLLKSRKLKPFEQMKGLAGLVQGQDSLERGYLRARDQHRALQQQGREPPAFDPDREVEGQIFRLGMRLEELRERVEQALQDHRGAMAPPSPPPALHPCSRPHGAGGPTPHPESPVSPVRGGFGGTVGAEVSSVSGESGEDYGELDEGLPSGLPPALLRKHHRVERDFDSLMDQYQSFRELPGILTEETTDVDSVLHTTSVEHDGIAPGLQRTDNEEVRRAVLPMQPDRGEKDTALDTPPEHTVDHLKGGLSLQEPLPLAGQQCGVVRQGGRKSHSSSLASLGGSTASERRGSKLHTRRSTAPSQDGLLSPETDSGFVGSESSHPMPAAGSLSQQGARMSRSAPLRERGEEPQPASDSARTPAPRRPVLQERVGGPSCAPEVLPSGPGPRGGPSLAPASASTSSSPQPWTSSLLCGSESESERAHSLSEREEGRGVRHTHLANRQPLRQPTPSPAMPRHHGHPLKALGSAQLTNRHEAIRSLQAEVSRLKERLEDSLRHPNPTSRIRSPPSASEEEGQPHSIHPDTRGREESEGRKRVREKEVQKRRRDPPRPAPRKRSASVPQHRPELDITTDSEYAQSVTKEQSSRRIPEASATQGGQKQARPVAVMHRGPYTRQLYRLTPPGGDEENDNGNQSSRTRACPNCRNGRMPSGGATDSAHRPLHSRCSQCCPLCRGSDWGRGRVTQPDGVSALRVKQPMDSPHKLGGVFLAAAPVPSTVPVVPCVPVCPSVLYVPSPVLKARPSYPQPLYLSLDGSAGSAAVRSQGSDRRHARSLSADNRALSRSLTRAIEAARGVRSASRSVARSLSSGLYQQGVLTQSYLR